MSTSVYYVLQILLIQTLLHKYLISTHEAAVSSIH